MSHPIQKRFSDILPLKLCWMRATSGPINPSNAPVGIHARLSFGHKGCQVVLILITWRLAMAFKNGVIRDTISTASFR